MAQRSIRLDPVAEKVYGRRVLLPGTAEHAAYQESKGATAEPESSAPEQDVEDSPGPDLSELTVPELRLIASRMGVSYKGLKKAELIQALQHAEV